MLSLTECGTTSESQLPPFSLSDSWMADPSTTRQSAIFLVVSLYAVDQRYAGTNIAEHLCASGRVCLCACVRVCMFVCSWVFGFLSLRVCGCACGHIRVCLGVWVCVVACVCVCVWLHVCVPPRVCVGV